MAAAASKRTDAEEILRNSVTPNRLSCQAPGGMVCALCLLRLGADEAALAAIDGRGVRRHDVPRPLHRTGPSLCLITRGLFKSHGV
jgi:hypothetical protein